MCYVCELCDTWLKQQYVYKSPPSSLYLSLVSCVSLHCIYPSVPVVLLRASPATLVHILVCPGVCLSITSMCPSYPRVCVSVTRVPVTECVSIITCA